MTGFGISDLARQLSLQSNAARLKQDTNRLTLELSTGKAAHQGALTSRDMSEISGLHRSLSLLTSLKTSIAETSLFVDVQQTALNVLQNDAEDLSTNLLSAGSARHPAQLNALSQDAEVRFKGLIATLNSRAADQSVFAGAATDGPALASADTILTALRTEIAAATGANDIKTTLENWFLTPGGGFDTIAYLGSDTPAGPFPLGIGTSASPQVTAASQPIREALMGFAMAAMIREPALVNLTEEKARLATLSAEVLLSNSTQLSDMRAGAGILQARIEEATTRSASEALSTEQALATLTASDPYRAATELQDAMTRLESLHTLTARISRLTLTEFLR